ncbi:hypothetical protein Y032_0018g3552 [Ancylostoma ceylanicum]|uniref:Uncharacterized protein n=1 Tax=Ancylostoma ceylanicum TaxID=53326 RepID=A0A016V2B5_9BILA|nr:hypothetical protein Y032_0018g3552 [Ancylostoma ceylanicum]
MTTKTKPGPYLQLLFSSYNYRNYDLQLSLHLLFYCLEVDPPIREERTTHRRKATDYCSTSIMSQMWLKSLIQKFHWRAAIRVVSNNAIFRKFGAERRPSYR